MKKYLLNIFFWTPAVMYMALIFFLSSAPPPQAARTVPVYFDIKIIHIVEYGVLNLLVYWALAKTWDIGYIWKAVFSVATAVLYGLTDELHQVFVPGRSGQLVDIAANFLGCTITQASVFMFRVKFRRNNYDI